MHRTIHLRALFLGAALALGASAGDRFSLDSVEPRRGELLSLETVGPQGRRSALRIEFLDARSVRVEFADERPVVASFRGYTWDGKVDYYGRMGERDVFVELDPVDGFVWASYREDAARVHDSFGPPDRVLPWLEPQLRFAVGGRDLAVRLISMFEAALVDPSRPEEVLAGLSVAHRGRNLLLREHCPEGSHIQCHRDHLQIEVGLSNMSYRYRDRSQKFSGIEASRGYVRAQALPLTAAAFGD